MKYTTKQARLCAIADAYRVKFNKSSFTTDEVCDWALKHDLWPVPIRGDNAVVCERWERKLEEARSKQEETP